MRYRERAAKRLRAADRAKLAQASRLPKAIENRYVRDLTSLLRAVHVRFLEAFDASHLATDRNGNVIRSNAKISKHDPSFNSILPSVRLGLQRGTEHAFDRMAAAVQKHATFALRGLTVQGLGQGFPELVQRARAANVALIDKAAAGYGADVRRVIEDPENFGLAGAELRDLIVERGNVSESRAQLIARDQSLKLNAVIGQEGQKRAGATGYSWGGVDDGKEREMHRALNNRVFRWDDPPVTNEEGDTNHPGEDYQCRCVAIPVFEEIEESGAYYE